MNICLIKNLKSVKLKMHNFYNFTQINKKIQITMNFPVSITQKLQILNRMSLLQKMRNAY